MGLDRRSFVTLCTQIGVIACGRAHQEDSIFGWPATQILALAGRAPSGHNTQPWTIRLVDKEHWVLGIDASRRLPGVDPTSRETLLSLGAFLENLIVAAMHNGYRIDYDILAKSSADVDVLDLRLRKANALPQKLDLIRLRRTVRDGFLATEIKSADLAAITSAGTPAGSDDAGEFVYFPRGSAAARYLSEGTVEANRRQAFRDPAQEELANWIRWSAADASRYGNGLTPASMEIGGLSGWYVSHFYDRASVLSKSFRDTTVQQVMARVEKGGGWLVVCSSAGSIATLIETGRTFQRMWLRLRERKIAIHPMTQMLEESPWREQVARHLGIEKTPQFLLRIGYLDSYPNPVSLRMPPDRIARWAKRV